MKIQSRAKALQLGRPVVMGILNATPDSFFNKGRHSDVAGLLTNAEKMIAEGAAILDVGGASTKPGQPLMTVDEELQRVMPAIKALRQRFPEVWLSIDTYNAAVAKAAVEEGADIINDVSSGSIDKDMLHAVAALGVPYIAMHMQGTPETMQRDPQYDDVVDEVRNYLRHVCDQCDEAGVAQVIIDPGFGFGKTVEHNFKLLGGLHTLSALGRPVMAGISRKSMVCKPLRVNPEHALNGTTALHMVALQQGANILRAHDVKEAMEVIVLARELGIGI